MYPRLPWYCSSSHDNPGSSITIHMPTFCIRCKYSIRNPDHQSVIRVPRPERENIHYFSSFKYFYDGRETLSQQPGAGQHTSGWGERNGAGGGAVQCLDTHYEMIRFHWPMSGPDTPHHHRVISTYHNIMWKLRTVFVSGNVSKYNVIKQLFQALAICRILRLGSDHTWWIF